MNFPPPGTSEGPGLPTPSLARCSGAPGPLQKERPWRGPALVWPWYGPGLAGFLGFGSIWLDVAWIWLDSGWIWLGLGLDFALSY